ncbi:hypothetical protein KF947_07235 [Halomonas sp. FeN2]|uniref:hypothetical protein n=1 Tax=Halomonadaceae TaxID=28256 RepID=UPI000C60E6A5|nr:MULTISPECIES: hypothetical protein [unclassified Halomonas]MBF58492.1 hypothetical protein [Halomonas sp.]TDV91131.1 hypothetical protein BDK62_11952 [Halomonas alkaliantarctica]UBR51266.1 hypothetical protein KF947_07235 [Halomonas sp. FeN2]
MNNSQHQLTIDKLQLLIDGTQATLACFEQKGMDIEMADDYIKLLDILDDAVKQQREHTKAMLS